MLIRIAEQQVLNADIAERFSFANTALKDDSEPLGTSGSTG